MVDWSRGGNMVGARKEFLYLGAIVIVSLLSFLPGLGAFGILDPSDGLYSESAREMLERHDWITPHFNYHPFFEKPILIYWAIGACYKVFGVSAWSARLPSALAATLCALSVYWFSRRILGRQAAMLAALALLSMPLFAVIGHLALTDMMVTLFSTVASLALFTRLNGGQHRLLLLAYLSLGLVVLTKGPVPALLVFVTAMIYQICRGPAAGDSWCRMWWRFALSLHPIAGLGLIVLVAAPWYVLENITTHGAFFQEFFVRQNLGRAAGTVNHQEPWNFYIPYFVAGFFPWWLSLPCAPATIALIWKRRKRQGRLGQLALFTLCWSVVIVGLFSAVKTKLATYILPACPPLAILAVILLMVSWRRRAKFSLAALLCAAIVFAVAVSLAPSTLTLGRSASTAARCLLFAGIAVLLLGLLLSLVLVAKTRLKSALRLSVFSTLLSMLLMVPAGLHVYDVIHDRPFRRLLALCRRSDISLAQMMRDSPAANFYLRKEVPVLVTKEELYGFVKDKPGKHWLLVTDDVLLFAVQRAPRLNLLGRQSKFSLFSIDP